MEIEKMDYLDAVKSLAQEFHIDIDPLLSKKQNDSESMSSWNKEQLKILLKKTQEYFSGQLATYHPAYDYLSTKRQLDTDYITHFWLGYAPDSYEELIKIMTQQGFGVEQLEAVWLAKKNERGSVFSFFRKRITIPVYDAHGTIVWFGARALDPDDNPKYLNSPDTILYDKSNILYGLHRAKDHLKTYKKIIVVEWYMDVIAAHRCDIPIAVATCGTALTEQHIKLLKRYTQHICLLFDNDEAGRQATVKALKTAYQHEIYPDMIILPSEYKDLDDVANDRSISWEQRIKILSTTQASKERIKNYISQSFDTASPIEKTKALSWYRDILSHIQNHVILDQFLQEATEIFGTQYEVLASEFKKYTKQQYGYKKELNKSRLINSVHTATINASSNISKEQLCASLFVDKYLEHIGITDSQLIWDRINFLINVANLMPETLMSKAMTNRLSDQERTELSSYHLRRDQQRETNMTQDQKRAMISRIITPTTQTLIQQIGKLSALDDIQKAEIITQRSQLKKQSIS